MLVFVLLIISAASPLVDNSAAQSVVPAVELTCSAPYPSGAIDIGVGPGATLTGYADCTVSNPTINQEKIQIQASGDGLAIAAPGSITLGGNSESDFQVSVRADSRMTMSARQLVVTATVTEANGVPPPNIAESQVTLIINILQFAEFNFEMVESFTMIEVGFDATLEYKIYNTGNWMDKFIFSTESESVENVDLSIPIVAMEVESRSSPSKFRVELRAPSDGSDWPINSDGLHTMEMEFDVTVKSDFSCREGECISMTLTQKIIFFQNQTVEEEPEDSVLSSSTDDQLLIYGGSGAAVILLLIMFLAMRRRK
jgi:hypothetical protein